MAQVLKQFDRQIFQEEDQMTPKEMIRFLKNMQSYESYLKNELQQMYSQAESFESAVVRRSLPERDFSDPVQTIPSYESDQTLKVLLNAREDVEREYELLSLRKKEIYEQQDHILFVKRCISHLPYDYQEILNDTFVQGDGWKAYIHKKCICQSYYYRQRKEAVQMLCEVYNKYVKKHKRIYAGIAAEEKTAYAASAVAGRSR